MTIRARVLTCLILGFFAGPVFAQVTTTSDYVTTAEALCMVVKSTDALSVPPAAVCGCRTPTANGPAECARPDEELSRLVDHDTTNHLAAYLTLLTDLAATKLPAVQRAYVRFIWPTVDGEGNLVARQILYRSHNGPLLIDTLPGILAGPSKPPTERPYLRHPGHVRSRRDHVERRASGAHHLLRVEEEEQPGVGNGSSWSAGRR